MLPRALIAIAVCVAAAQPKVVLGGLYHRDLIAGYEIDEKGYAHPLEIDAFLTMLNLVKKADNLSADAAQPIVQAIGERERKGVDALSPSEQLDLATDELRLRTASDKHEQATGLLLNLRRRPPVGLEFLVLSHLAHAYLLRLSDKTDAYADAASQEDSALNDYDFPTKLLGLSPAQLAWYRRLEKDYYLPLLRQRARTLREQRGKLPDELDPIFARSANGANEPVRFVGSSGTFEVGTIDASQALGLPPDAIAIVQQMLLWWPDDGRLWWQLAELYNARGDLKSAARAFKLCTEEAKYTNHELRSHFDLVLTAVQQGAEEQLRERQARDAAEAAQRRLAENERRQSMFLAAGIVLAVIGLMGYWQVREVARRWQARRLRTARRQPTQ